MREVSLYIHVPFCKRRCSYCTFYHLPHVDEHETAFVDTLVRELAWVLADAEGDIVFPTVFFGGGTPSTLTTASFARIFSAISPRFTTDCEVTIEANPEDVTLERLTHLRSLGVNRVSVGIQSMNAPALRVLKRCSPDVNRRGIEWVSQVFDNFSVDLVLGIPDSTVDTTRATVREVLRFEPPHASIYCLEPGGVMMDEVGDFFDHVDAERSADEYLAVCKLMGDAGYAHYEISNFARPGRECRHNQVYWASGEWVGVGPAAHSYLGGVRFSNEPSIRRYVEAGRDFSTIRSVDHRAEGDRELERLMLALRTSQGLAVAETTCQPTVLHELTVAGLGRVSAGRLVLTDRGYLVLNEIVMRIAQAA